MDLLDDGLTAAVAAEPAADDGGEQSGASAAVYDEQAAGSELRQVGRGQPLQEQARRLALVEARRPAAGVAPQGRGQVLLDQQVALGQGLAPGVEALAGCDRLTISPDLLQQLEADDDALPQRLCDDGDRSPRPPALSQSAFLFANNQDPMVAEKLSDGIRRFVADQEKLEALLSH